MASELQSLRAQAAERAVPAGWLAVHINGQGFYSSPLKTEDEAKRYINQVEQSNDSVTLVARPFAWADAAPAQPAAQPAQVEPVRVGLQEFDLSSGGAHFTAGDMATASAQAFREGQAAARAPVAGAGGVVSDWRDQVLRLAQFADTATRMSVKDMHNNMETLADELTKLLAAAPQPPAPAATAEALDAARWRFVETAQGSLNSRLLSGRTDRRARLVDAALAAQQKDTP